MVNVCNPSRDTQKWELHPVVYPASEGLEAPVDDVRHGEDLVQIKNTKLGLCITAASSQSELARKFTKVKSSEEKNSVMLLKCHLHRI